MNLVKSLALAACAAVLLSPSLGAPVEKAIRISDAPVLLRKVPVSDCRILRGFAGEPVDGTVKSSDHWFGRVREYPPMAGAYGWSYNGGDGLHVTLADDHGFDVVVLRGGAGAEVYADATHYARPGGGRLLGTFPGASEVQVIRLSETAKAKRVSFFKVKGDKTSHVGDVAFYRIGKPDEPGVAEKWIADNAPLTLPPAASKFDVMNVMHGMSERYDEAARNESCSEVGRSMKSSMICEKDADTGVT